MPGVLSQHNGSLFMLPAPRRSRPQTKQWKLDLVAALTAVITVAGLLAYAEALIVFVEGAL